jgi:hypothetical protein
MSLADVGAILRRTTIRFEEQPRRLALRKNSSPIPLWHELFRATSVRQTAEFGAVNFVEFVARLRTV